MELEHGKDLGFTQSFPHRLPQNISLNLERYSVKRDIKSCYATRPHIYAISGKTLQHRKVPSKFPEKTKQERLSHLGTPELI